MSPFITYMLIVALILGVIAMNVSIFTDERYKKEGALYAFKSKKLYLWFVPLAAIFFTVVLSNV